jgi:tetratricopeptide (TPR) repeat protein
MNMGRNKEALEVFSDLAKLVPRETPVHIMIGKCHKILGNKELALKSFNRALDLDPKDTNQVKCLIDKIDQSSDLNEDADLHDL